MFVKARIRLLFSAIVAFSTAVTVVVIGKYICESYLLFIIASLAFSNFVAIIAEFIMLQKTKSRDDDSIYTFGFVRAGLIGTVVNQIFLFGLFFNVVVESLQAFIKLTVANDNNTLTEQDEIDEIRSEMGSSTIATSTREEMDEATLTGYQVLFVSVGALVVQVFVVLLYHLHGYLWHKLSCSNSLGPQTEALIADPYFNINPWSKFLHSWQNHHISMEGSITDGHPAQVAKSSHPLYNKSWVRTFFLDVSGSFFACIVAIASSFLLLYGSHLPLYHLADPALSLVVILFVVGTRAPILRDTMLILLQTLPRGVNTQRLGKRIVNEVQGILSIHELHVWQLTSKRLVATVHVTISKSSDYMGVAAQVKHIFHSEGIHSLTLQPEFIERYPDVSPSDGVCLLDCASKEEDVNPLTDCVSHQCCHEPVVVFPDEGQQNGNETGKGGAAFSSSQRSLMNPPVDIPMIDSSMPNTPYFQLKASANEKKDVDPEGEQPKTTTLRNSDSKLSTDV